MKNIFLIFKKQFVGIEYKGILLILSIYKKFKISLFQSLNIIFSMTIYLMSFISLISLYPYT